MEKPKYYRAAKVDRDTIGVIAVIVDGPDGKNGIAKRATKVRKLDENCKKLKAEIAEKENEIARLKEKHGVLGDVFGPLESMFRGHYKELDRLKEQHDSDTKKMHEESSVVLDGITKIEEAIAEYVSRDTQYQAAQKLEALFPHLKMFAGLYNNAVRGMAKNIPEAEQLKDNNKPKLNELLAEYWSLIRKAPRWIGTVPFSVTTGTMDVAGLDANLSALKEKMDTYIAELKGSLSKDHQTYISQTEKEYFKTRAQPGLTGEEA